MISPSVDPRWAKAAEQLLVDTVTSARPTPKRRLRAREAEHRRRSQLLVTAATAVLLTAATWLVLDHRLAGEIGATAPSPTISVDGRSVPFAGRIPWSRPVAESVEARDIVIYADGDRIRSSIFICGIPIERVQVVETPQSVTIAVNGYANASPGFCGSSGTPLQPLLITLSQPLGDRALIDRSDGQSRPLTTTSPTAMTADRAAAAGFPDTAERLRENARRTTATARKSALALLDRAPLPPGTERAASTSIAALRSGPFTAGCVPSAVVWRLLGVPAADRDTVSTYLQKHPAAGFMRVNASTAKSTATLIRGLAQSTSQASLQYEVAQDGSAVAIRATASVYQPEADCTYRAKYGGFHPVDVGPSP